MVACLRFYITVPNTIDNRFQKKHKVTPSGILKKSLICVSIKVIKSLYKLLQHPFYIQMPSNNKVILFLYPGIIYSTRGKFLRNK